MKIEKEVLIKAVDDNGNALVEGKTYAFDIKDNMCLVGRYVGITKRGALAFESILDSKFLCTFNVMPSSIVQIKQVEVLDKVVK